jgi:hypothetical protein
MANEDVAQLAENVKGVASSAVKHVQEMLRHAAGTCIVELHVVF